MRLTDAGFPAGAIVATPNSVQAPSGAEKMVTCTQSRFSIICCCRIYIAVKAAIRRCKMSHSSALVSKDAGSIATTSEAFLSSFDCPKDLQDMILIWFLLCLLLLAQRYEVGNLGHAL